MFPDMLDAMSDVIFATLSEPATVNGTTVAGLFTDAVAGGEPMNVKLPVGQQSQAVLEIEPASLTFTPEIGDAVHARGTDFSVVDIIHDACGNLKLILHR